MRSGSVQGKFVPVLKIRGKCSRLRAKPAHLVGHLPDNEDYRNSAILAFLLAQETAWKAIKWVLKDKIAIEVAGPRVKSLALH